MWVKESKKSIYIACHRETSTVLYASVRCEHKRLQRLSKTVPANNRIPQAVWQGIPDRRTSHTESPSAIGAEPVARYDYKSCRVADRRCCRDVTHATSWHDNTNVNFIISPLIQQAYLVVNFEAGECGVLKANVNADHVVNQGVGLVSFEWWGNGQTRLCIAVQNIHQLLFLNSA